MNKGVELLLARRETNPEEFYPSDIKRYGRWYTLLISHGVNLDNPTAKVHKPIIFTREVTKRLLTACDLAPIPEIKALSQLLAMRNAQRKIGVVDER